MTGAEPASDARTTKQGVAPDHHSAAVLACSRFTWRFLGGGELCSAPAVARGLAVC